MDTVVQNFETMMSNNYKKIVEDMENWGQQHLGQVRSIIEQQLESPEMFTEKYGEVTLGQTIIEMRSILYNVIKNRSRSDEWIIYHCIYPTQISPRGIYEYCPHEFVVTNYGSLYSLLINEYSNGDKIFMGYVRDTKLPNDMIDHIKIMYSIIVSQIGDPRNNSGCKEETQVTERMENVAKIKFSFANYNDEKGQMISNCSALYKMRTTQKEWTKNMMIYTLKCVGGQYCIIDERMCTDCDYTPLFLAHVVTMENNDKYWNRNCVGQEALKIKHENEELKEKYERYATDRQKLDEMMEKFRSEKEEFDKTKMEFSDVVGLTKLEEEKKRFNEERTRFENESGLEFIRSEKERLKNVKEQLCNTRVIIAQERRNLDKDITEFENKKKLVVIDVDKIDI